jgi:hypothetical protein
VAVTDGRMTEHSEYPLCLQPVRCRLSGRKVHDPERPAPLEEATWLLARLKL